jgi:hypothetical protein
MTVPTPDRRQVARITVPQQLRGPGLERLRGCLLDLSATGAQIEHTDPVSEGLVCEVDFPSALGRGRLKGRVVWTKVHRREQTFGGDTRVFYQSGLIFVDLTPEQQAKLANALQILKTNV